MQFTKLTTFFALAALFCSALATPMPRPGYPHEEEHHGHNIDENISDSSSFDNFENTELAQNTASKDSKNAGMCSGDSKTYCCNSEKTGPNKGGISFINELTTGNMQCSQMPISMPSAPGIGGACKFSYVLRAVGFWFQILMLCGGMIVSFQESTQETCKQEVFCCTGDKVVSAQIFLALNYSVILTAWIRPKPDSST